MKKKMVKKIPNDKLVVEENGSTHSSTSSFEPIQKNHNGIS